MKCLGVDICMDEQENKQENYFLAHQCCDSDIKNFYWEYSG